MRFKWLTDYWQGTLLGLCTIIVSLWLGFSGKLVLYIHPRYVLFTVIMSVLALGVILLGFWRHTYNGKIVEGRRMPALLLGLLCLLVSVGLLVTKPSALTSDTATQRGINTGALDLASQSSAMVQLPTNADYSRFSIKEWASLLSQTNDPRFFERKKVDVVGFISPSGNNPDEFFVSRFVVTCCAVDARPIGIPIRLPNWRGTYKTDQWVRIEGNFVTQSDEKGAGVAVEPGNITKVDQPEDPYAH